MARGSIQGVLEGETLLKDISITGCCLECNVIADIQIGSQYELDIDPERVSGIGHFQLLVECKWMRDDKYSTVIGFLIVASPKGRQFQRYVDYMTYRNSGG